MDELFENPQYYSLPALGFGLVWFYCLKLLVQNRERKWL